MPSEEDRRWIEPRLEGLLGLGEISAGVRDILAVTDLPCLVDVDTGYGDVKNAVYTLNHYERIGAQAIFIEDQLAPKRCGHMAGKAVMASSRLIVLRTSRPGCSSPSSIISLMRLMSAPSMPTRSVLTVILFLASHFGASPTHKAPRNQEKAKTSP